MFAGHEPCRIYRILHAGDVGAPEILKRCVNRACTASAECRHQLAHSA